MDDPSCRAIGIVRVSQKDDDSGHSSEVQVRALLKQAAGDGFSLAPGDIWDENVDDDGRIRKASGGAALADRPRLLAAVETIERGEAAILVAERFDRLFRDLDIQRAVIRRVEAAGGRLVTAAGQISHATAEAELHANLNGSIAQYQKRTATERSKAAVQLAIDAGVAPWPRVTAGYLKREDGIYSPDPRVAPVIAEAFERRASGKTVREVREYLREHGVEMSYAGVVKLLSSRVVLGEIHSGSYTPNLTAHPAIVDLDTWNLVQRTRVPAGRNTKSERLLARLGILHCGTCDSKLVASITIGAGGGRYPIYRCQNDDCARRVTISAPMVEERVVAVVLAIHANVRGRASHVAHHRGVVDAADRAQLDLDAAIRVADIVGDEPAATARLTAALQRRNETRAAAEALGSVEDAETFDVSGWDRMALDARRATIRRTLARVRVDPGRGDGRLDFEPLLQ